MFDFRIDVIMRRYLASTFTLTFIELHVHDVTVPHLV